MSFHETPWGKNERITGALDKQCYKVRLLLFTRRHNCWHASREYFEQPVIMRSQLQQSRHIQPRLSCPKKRIIANKQKVSIPSYSSRERGLNENTNGLVPQSLPKL
jgi:hypothetical protein